MLSYSDFREGLFRHNLLGASRGDTILVKKFDLSQPPANRGFDCEIGPKIGSQQPFDCDRFKQKVCLFASRLNNQLLHLSYCIAQPHENGARHDTVPDIQLAHTCNRRDRLNI